VFHPNADCDAVGSAVALRRNFPGFDISGAGGISRLGKRLLEFVGERVLDPPEFQSYDAIVVLDTSNLLSLGIPSEILDAKRKIIIDHHLKSGNVKGVELYHCDDSKPSCAEIIWELLNVKGAGEAPGAGTAQARGVDRETAAALSAGILTDTGHLRFAKTSTVKALSEMLERSGLALEEVLALMEDDVPDMSRKVAFLKGAQRLRFEPAGEYIVAASHVSAFEGALSKTLLALGADVVFVGAQAKKEFRVSGRATQALVRRGFHVGKLMEEAGREMGGQGGGHAGAAGMSGEGEMEAAVNILMEKAITALKQMPKGG
jgi:nanoRNase/pAp phosphatase (c-di-AMP/oligoRNAs hydrolase)